jgi:hypothetical protein
VQNVNPNLVFWQLIVSEIVEHDFCWDAISAGTRFLADTRSLLERATWLAWGKLCDT